MEINLKNFSKFKILVGTVISVSKNEKAKKPAYSMDIDFGKPTGVKKTSAQITNYKFEDLLNSQIVAVTNFPSKNIAGIVSEVLILGAMTSNGVNLLRVDMRIKNGTLVG